MATTHAGQEPNANKAHTASNRPVVCYRERVAIGASGAASQAAAVGKSTGYDSNGFTCTKNNTGIYTLVFPKCRRAFIQVTLYSPAKTVVGCVLTALDATAGTATVKTLAGSNAAAETEPASGDILFISLDLEP
jgi:hypothetical protein